MELILRNGCYLPILIFVKSHWLHRGRGNTEASNTAIQPPINTPLITRCYLCKIGLQRLAKTLCLLLFVVSCYPVAANNSPPWAIYYGSELGPESFAAYDLLVLDSENHPLLSPLLKPGKVVLGYLSLASVASHRSGYQALKKAGIVLAENNKRPGNFVVDIRDVRWTKRVIEQLIPGILHQGFTGIFIDSLDNALQLENNGNDKNANHRGMSEAAIRLIKTIRRHYPTLKIMLNGSYRILPEVGDVIDMQLGESLFSEYTLASGVYQRTDQMQSSRQLKILQAAAKKYPKLDIYTLDYWNTDDLAGMAEIYKVSRSYGFNPYVSTVALQGIIREPSSAEPFDTQASAVEKAF